MSSKENEEKIDPMPAVPNPEQTGSTAENISKENDLKLQESVAAEVANLQNQQNVQKAVDFLSNPKVQTAPKEEKIKFLKGKGLTDGEIQTAFEKVASTKLTNTALPPPTPISESTNSIQPVAKTSVVQPRPTRYFLLLYLLPILGGGSWIVYQMKWLQAVYIPFLELYEAQVAKRLKSTSAYFQDAFAFCTLYKSVLDCDEADTSISKSFKEMVYSVSKNISKLNNQLQDATVRPNIYKEVSLEAQNLGQAVRQATYYPAYSTYHSEANSIKSEIRSLKGLLLSRRNFPTAGKLKQ
ncbi:hypothetical protein HDV04_000224 [Boothiomyces sp. JEL0838]|nr:hypothetical protein HDV04_000224 [Boothiomyces sp. JEL0838]